MAELQLPDELRRLVLDFAVGTREHWRSLYAPCMEQLLRRCSVDRCGVLYARGFMHRWLVVWHSSLSRNRPHLWYVCCEYDTND